MNISFSDTYKIHIIKSLLCEILVLELINVIERKLYSSWNKAFLFPLGIIADGMRDRKRYFKVKSPRLNIQYIYGHVLHHFVTIDGGGSGEGK